MSAPHWGSNYMARLSSLLHLVEFCADICNWKWIVPVHYLIHIHTASISHFSNRENSKILGMLLNTSANTYGSHGS